MAFLCFSCGSRLCPTQDRSDPDCDRSQLGHDPGTNFKRSRDLRLSHGMLLPDCYQDLPLTPTRHTWLSHLPVRKSVQTHLKCLELLPSPATGPKRQKVPMQLSTGHIQVAARPKLPGVSARSRCSTPCEPRPRRRALKIRRQTRLNK